jgi:hypothetical protein
MCLLLIGVDRGGSNLLGSGGMLFDFNERYLTNLMGLHFLVAFTTEVNVFIYVKHLYALKLF